MVIVSRLAAIEAQQRVHTRMMQAILNASQQQQRLEACELPDDMTLPLQTIDDLLQMEKRLGDMETKTLLVSQSVQVDIFKHCVS